jgi:DNA invertase Pin-like site-specific DNA recombinase
MIIGYARTSRLQQQAGYEAQLRDLQQAGCDKIFGEQVSSVAEREELTRALEFVRSGDVLVVCKLDRLARSMRHLLDITQLLERKRVTLRILGMQLDTGTATGKLMLSMLGAFAEFERETMLERQREGIAKAKSEGKYKGRVPTARRQYDRIRELSDEGVGPSDIARKLGVGRTSVYRALRSTTTATDQTGTPAAVEAVLANERTSA